MIISLIAAVGANGVIGAKGDLPWHLPNDLRFFSKTTRGHHVVMGRKNYDSIPEQYRPLPGRPNVVVTRDRNFKADAVQVVFSIEDAVEYARSKGESELFIIGGGEIYRQSIHLADRLYLTHVDAAPDGDTFFPAFDESAWSKTLVLEQKADAVHNASFKTYVYVKTQ